MIVCQLPTVALPQNALFFVFRFLTLLALKLFVQLKLDVIVLEVGLGGRLDATNIIPSPVATAVTTLDYDHVELLGHTLALIATEKAGIFRAGVPAFTCDQVPEAMEALVESARKVCHTAAAHFGQSACCLLDFVPNKQS
jgi:folylpolyglutamate synthase/dihydropteroate synthase